MLRRCTGTDPVMLKSGFGSREIGGASISHLDGRKKKL